MHADTYLAYLEATGMPGYKTIPGNLSAKIWRRIEGDVCHFWTISEWDSYEAIRHFAGNDFTKAQYYPEDGQYLLEFEEEVQHFETFEY